MYTPSRNTLESLFFILVDDSIFAAVWDTCSIFGPVIKISSPCTVILVSFPSIFDTLADRSPKKFSIKTSCPLILTDMGKCANTIFNL